ncbi:transposase [Escherichia coli]|uniref:transposase n=1 Tax=Escherichia coli TaxID=562 RepID=UPI00193AFE98|nr:transposase [Escherichia coli]
MSDMQKNVTPGRRKGCPNYPPEFKQLLVAASCEPGISISKLALENGINANLLVTGSFKPSGLFPPALQK